MTDKNHAARIDILLLYLARGVRGFGDGFAIIILPAYLAALVSARHRLASFLVRHCLAPRC